MPFLPPNQQRQSTEGRKIIKIFWPNVIYFGAKLIVHNIRKIFRYRLELEQ